MSKKYLVLLLFILVNSNFAFSQIVGEWIASYSYKMDYDDKFDMDNKSLNLKGGLIITEDSIYSFNEKNNIGDKYIYKNDSIFITNKSHTKYYQFILNKDTIYFIDNKYKGNYTVMQRVSKSKNQYSIKGVNNALLNNSFIVDLSTILTPVIPNNIQTIDTMLFASNNLIVGKNKKGFSKWNLLSTSRNVYLVFDKRLFQVYKVNKRKIILKSYFDKEHSFILKRI